MRVVPPTTRPPDRARTFYCPRCKYPYSALQAVCEVDTSRVPARPCRTCRDQTRALQHAVHEFIRSLRPPKPERTPKVEPERVVIPVDRTTCWSHKAYFSTELEAFQYRSAHPKAKGLKRTYNCPWCGGWHFTHTKLKKIKIVGSWK